MKIDVPSADSPSIDLIPADLSDIALARLAREMVMNIRNYKDIFGDYGIDENEYDRIEKLPYYQKVREQLAREWNATTSTKERTQAQALAGIEQMLPHVIKRALDPETPLPAATEVTKAVMKIAGLDGRPAEEKASGERFIIQINMGEDQRTYDKAIMATEPIAIEGET